MKTWHWILVLVLTAALAFAAGYGVCWLWLITPLGPPLDIHKAVQLAEDYTRFWLLWAGVILAYLTVVFGVPWWMMALKKEGKQ